MYTVEVKEDPKTKEPFIEFPDELMESLDWKEGDTLEWIICEASEMAIHDDYIILRKKPE